MADWWMDDDQIASQYRCAADRVEQIKILGQLCAATKKEVLNKLLQIGSIDNEKYEELLSAFSDKRRASPRTLETWKQLYESGYSDAAIGQLTGSTRGAIKEWRKRTNRKANDPALAVDGTWRKQTRKKEEAEVER